MTIDEAIRHCEEVAEKNDDEAEVYDLLAKNHKSTYEKLTASRFYADCKECASDHQQLAEWLRELKDLRETVGALKLNNMKEALALIRAQKAQLEGWKNDPFSIIAEACRPMTDCGDCQWDEVCPYSRNHIMYEEYPDEWRE